jgi:aspartate racemase
VYPDADAQLALMDAIYGKGGIRAGDHDPALLQKLQAICEGLADKGCDIIVPGMTELSLVHAALAASLALPVLNVNRCYADYALSRPTTLPRRAFKIGVVGGVGPLATVDFMEKVVTLTEAQRDQDHIKMIVEQNPQIPDRTEHLLHQGTDPTIALFATCKKLEAAEADLIAIPCNTAHAFVDRMQSHLRIPVLNMLDEAMAQIAGRYAGRLIGLLATSGTVESGVYAEAAARARVQLMLPDVAHQALVMDAIYGAEGVKAGFTDGKCKTDLRAAIEHLAQRGAGVILLGCTELPLLFPQTEGFDAAGQVVALLDPTLLLASACVRHARAARR